ncbi:MAG: nucleotide exchange factor GrpE, partial [Treponema sp.]|nr:nucleotide exchange factor GrpE [Treponema sp.]
MSKNHTHEGSKAESAPIAENSGGEDLSQKSTAACPAEELPDTVNPEPGSKGTDGGKTPQAEPGPEEIIADLEAQLADAKDQYLRKAADFENFRKRMIREKQDAIDFANQALLLDLIPIIDDFERA